MTAEHLEGDQAETDRHDEDDRRDLHEVPLLANGTVKPAIDRSYPLEEAAETTRHLIEDRPFGKVILTI